MDTIPPVSEGDCGSPQSPPSGEGVGLSVLSHPSPWVKGGPSRQESPGPSGSGHTDRVRGSSSSKEEQVALLGGKAQGSSQARRWERDGRVCGHLLPTFHLRH